MHVALTNTKMKKLILLLIVVTLQPAWAQVNPKLQAKFDQQAKEVEAKVIEWRRYLHQNPELSNREVKTGAYIAEYLKTLGLKVQTGVAHTGVVGLLETGKPDRLSHCVPTWMPCRSLSATVCLLLQK